MLIAFLRVLLQETFQFKRLKTANAMGLAIAPVVLGRADEVIE